MKSYNLKVDTPYDDVKINFINIDSDTIINEYIDNGALHNIYIVKSEAKLTIETVIDNSKNEEHNVIDMYHKVELRSDNSEVKINVKGVVDGNNKIIYRSTIVTNDNYQNLKGEEKLRFVILNNEAEIDAIPSLEIARNNVNASHSLNIERLDEKKLFYLVNHGLDIDEARKAYVSGLLK